jgi:hypothetical protein
MEFLRRTGVLPSGTYRLRGAFYPGWTNHSQVFDALVPDAKMLSHATKISFANCCSGNMAIDSPPGNLLMRAGHDLRGDGALLPFLPLFLSYHTRGEYTCTATVLPAVANKWGGLFISSQGPSVDQCQ